MAGIYIHIPFCKQACYYCDFHFSTNQSIKEDLIQSISMELHLQKNYLQGEKIETIYFGGGTPSLLARHELELVLNSIYKHFSVIASPEVTLEANPDDLTIEKIIALKEVGINRISLGIQSFDDAVLKFLNRAHTGEDAMTCVSRLRDHEFHNLSIDLIHSIPDQTDFILKQNLEKVISLVPEHISVYSLTIEEKTVFGKWSSRGRLKALEESQSAEQFELVMNTLIANGYHHYEISNFCLPGFASRHNTSYWQQKKYLGVGPSAHSFDLESRQFNVSNNHIYIKSIREEKVPYERELLTKENKINEYLFTTLRTSQGCELSYLLNNFDYDLLKINTDYIESLLQLEFVILKDGVLMLTHQGKLMADKIASDLFASLE